MSSRPPRKKNIYFYQFNFLFHEQKCTKTEINFPTILCILDSENTAIITLNSCTFWN